MGGWTKPFEPIGLKNLQTKVAGVKTLFHSQRISRGYFKRWRYQETNHWSRLVYKFPVTLKPFIIFYFVLITLNIDLSRASTRQISFHHKASFSWRVNKFAWVIGEIVTELKHKQGREAAVIYRQWSVKRFYLFGKLINLQDNLWRLSFEC